MPQYSSDVFTLIWEISYISFLHSRSFRFSLSPCSLLWSLYFSVLVSCISYTWILPVCIQLQCIVICGSTNLSDVTANTWRTENHWFTLPFFQFLFFMLMGPEYLIIFLERWMKTVLNGEVESKRDDWSLSFNYSYGHDLIRSNVIG